MRVGPLLVSHVDQILYCLVLKQDIQFKFTVHLSHGETNLTQTGTFRHNFGLWGRQRTLTLQSNGRGFGCGDMQKR